MEFAKASSFGDSPASLGCEFVTRDDAALRTVEHRGGLDAFLMKADSAELSQRARLLKKQVTKKLAEAEAAAA